MKSMHFFLRSRPTVQCKIGLGNNFILLHFFAVLLFKIDFWKNLDFFFASIPLSRNAQMLKREVAKRSLFPKRKSNFPFLWICFGFFLLQTWSNKPHAVKSDVRVRQKCLERHSSNIACRFVSQAFLQRFFSCTLNSALNKRHFVKCDLSFVIVA